MKQKIISCVVLLLFACNIITSFFSSNVTADDTFEDATVVLDGEIVYDFLDINSDPADYYKINVEANKILEIIMTLNQSDFDLYLYNENQTQLAKSDNRGSSNEFIQIKVTKTQDLYIKASAFEGSGSYSIEFWSGGHLDIYEDHYYYSRIKGVKTGDRLEYIVDLDSGSPKVDVYLLDSDNFYKFQKWYTFSACKKHLNTGYVRANYTFNITPSAPVSIKPETTHNSTPKLSWNSNNDYYLIYDFTDRDTDPPWNFWRDIAHLFYDFKLVKGSGGPDIFYNVNIWEGINSSGQIVLENTTTYENYYIIETELEYYQDYYIEIYAEKNGIKSSTTSSWMSVINNAPCASAYFPFENPIIYEFEPIFLSGGKSYDMDGDDISYTWDMGDGNILKGSEISHLYTNSGDFEIVLNVTDSIGASGYYSINLSIEPFDYIQYTIHNSIISDTTTTIYTNYSINSPIEISSGWYHINMPWPFSDRSFEVALIFNITLNHTGSVDYTFSVSELENSITISTDMVGSHDSYSLIFRPEIRFSWYKHSDYEIHDIVFPFPTLTEVYTGQPKVVLPYIGEVYFWEDFVELQNISLVDSIGYLQQMLADVDLIEIDIYEYIMKLVDELTWLGFSDIANFFLDFFFDIQIEIWLVFGIEIFTKVSEKSMFYLETSGEFDDDDDFSFSEGDYLTSSRGLIEFYYPDTDSSTLSVSNLTTTKAITMYSFNYVYLNPGILGYVDIKYRVNDDNPYNRIRLFETNSVERYAMDAIYFDTYYTCYAEDLDGDGTPDVSDEDIDGDGVKNSDDAYPYDSSRYESKTDLEKILGNPNIWILAIAIIIVIAIVITVKKRG
jgi:hypothetical protein